VMSDFEKLLDELFMTDTAIKDGLLSRHQAEIARAVKAEREEHIKKDMALNGISHIAYNHATSNTDKVSQIQDALGKIGW